jgi:hypothetical protein
VPGSFGTKVADHVMSVPPSGRGVRSMTARYDRNSPPRFPRHRGPGAEDPDVAHPSRGVRVAAALDLGTVQRRPRRPRARAEQQVVERARCGLGVCANGVGVGHEPTVGFRAAAGPCVRVPHHHRKIADRLASSSM